MPKLPDCILVLPQRFGCRHWDGFFGRVEPPILKQHASLFTFTERVMFGFSTVEMIIVASVALIVMLIFVLRTTKRK